MTGNNNFFIREREKEIKEFNEILNPYKSKNENLFKEKSYNANLISFAFKLLGQKLQTKIIERKDNIPAILNDNDIPNRFVDPLSIDINSEFGTLIGINKKTQNGFILHQDRGKPFIYGKYTSLQISDNFPMRVSLSKNEFDEIVKNSYPLFIQIFAQLPFKVNNINELLEFTFKNSSSDIKNVLLTTLVIAIINLLIPVFTSSIYGQIVPTSDFGYLIWLVLTLIPISLSLFISSFIRARLFVKLKNFIEYRIQAALVNRILRQPLEFIQKFNVSEFVSRTVGITDIVLTLSNATLGALFGLIFGIISFFMMFLYERNLSLIILFFYVIYSFIFYANAKRQRKLQEKVLDMNMKTLDATTLLLKSIPQIRSTATESFFLKNWAKKIKKEAETSYKRQEISFNLEVFSSSMYQITMFILMILVAFDFYRFSNNLSTFSYTGLFPYTTDRAGNFLAFTVAFNSFHLYYESFVLVVTDNVISVYAQWKLSSPLIFQDLEPGYLPGLASIIPKGNIKFSNVIYDTPGGKTIISNLNLNIKAGEYVGLTGPSGSGKSTFIRLITAILLPSAGTILIDGIDMVKLDLKSLRESIGVVTQNTQLPSTTIRNFIAPPGTFSDDEIWDSLKLACIDDEIKNMPMNINTILSEGATNISGGQRQRIVIAKALVKKPKILLLDDASSALSEEMQEKLIQNISNLKITTISIAHRISTLKLCDNVHIFENGKITESGTYKELATKNKYFKSLSEG